MPATPVKFRCYRCNQLLGISRSKVGAVVSCPKCLAELLVPDPNEAPPAVVHADESSRTRPFVTGALDVGLSFDLLDLRPEDIRAEPGASYVPTPSAPSESTEPAGEDEEAREPWAQAPPVEDREEPELTPEPVMSAPEPTGPDPSAEAPTIVSPAGIEALPPEPSRVPLPRARDLVLPRSVVAAWSLFVLLAQALSFFAGLLAGHYLWRVH